MADLSSIKAATLIEILKVSKNQDQINEIATELSARMSDITEVQELYKKALGYKEKSLTKRKYRNDKTNN